MEYIIVEEGYVKDLERAVNMWIKRGYVPFGNVVFAKTFHEVCYLQAMLKRDENEMWPLR